MSKGSEKKTGRRRVSRDGCGEVSLVRALSCLSIGITFTEFAKCVGGKVPASRCLRFLESVGVVVTRSEGRRRLIADVQLPLSVIMAMRFVRSVVDNIDAVIREGAYGYVKGIVAAMSVLGSPVVTEELAKARLPQSEAGRAIEEATECLSKKLVPILVKRSAEEVRQSRIRVKKIGGTGSDATSQEPPM